MLESRPEDALVKLVKLVNLVKFVNLETLNAEETLLTEDLKKRQLLTYSLTHSLADNLKA